MPDWQPCLLGGGGGGTYTICRRVPSLLRMPVTYSVESPALFLILASGKVTLAEASGVLTEIGEDKRLMPGSKMLIDGRTVTGAPLRPELRQIARQMADLKDLGLVATAIVTNQGFIYGVARMFAMFAELVGYRVGVCLTMREGFDWLGEQQPPVPSS